nr:hypothetical protein [Tanacetum cinerariifolium]
MSSYNQYDCEYCGGPHNGRNCPGCNMVESGNGFVYDQNPYSYHGTNDFFNQPSQYPMKTYSYEFCGGSPHLGYDCQIGNTLVYDQGPCYNQDFGYDQPPYYSSSQPQQFDCCEVHGGPHYGSDCQTVKEMLGLRNSSHDPPVELYDLEGSDEGDMEIDSLIKEPLDTLLIGMRESEVTSDSNLECDMHVNTLLPTTYDINSPLGEHVVEFLIENEDIADLPRHLVKQLISHLVKNQSSTKRMSRDEHGTGPSGGKTRVMETPSFGFHHMPSPRPAAYSPKEVMYRYYHPHLTSGDGFDTEIKKIPSDKSKVHIEVLSVL